MSPSFGGPDYTQPNTRELSQITESPNPEASDYADAGKFAAIVQRHDYELKALAQQTQQLQQGVNDATQNPIQQIQQFIADVVVLLGGGEITQGVLDFGDLQYILPTLGALFGLGDAPFPIDLFQAAEKFFFGYVVPNQQFTDEINTIISNWLTLIGIDPQFIKDVKALVTAVGELFGEVGNILPSLASLFGELGISANDLGPLGQLLAPIIKFFSGINLKDIGSLLEFVTSAIDPFVKDLTAIINFLNEVLAIFGFESTNQGASVVNSPLPQLTQPFANLMAFFGNIDFGISDFQPLAAAEQWIENVLSPTNLLATVKNIGQAITGLTGDVDLGQITTWFTNLSRFFAGMNLNDGAFDPVAGAEQFIRQVLSRTGLVLGPDSPISLGALTTNQPNLLVAPLFAADAVGPNPDWSVDPNSSRTADGTGSVVVNADGRFKALRSGSDPTDVIKVGTGQTITAAIWVSHQGYMGSGSTAPVILQVVPFTTATDGTQVRTGDFVTVDSFTPSQGDLAWPGHQMTGSYKVPDGVTGIQIRLLITDTGKSGTFRFDDGSVTQSAVIPKSWVEELEEDLGGVQQQVGATWDMITSVATGIPAVGSALQDAENALKQFNPANILGPLGSVNLAGDMQQIVNMLVGGLRGKPVTADASVADIYAAASQAATNVAGSDVTNNYDASGTIPISSWAIYLDIVGIGKGQDGEDGSANPIPGFFGQGGNPGKWNATTWQRGVHFDSGVTAITFTVNSDGSIRFSIPAGTSTPAQSLTCLPGSGAETPHFAGGWQGIGPSPTKFIYNGGNYVGGDTQNNPGGAGLGPGGGGAGGVGILLQPGGKGAAPRGWVRQRANAVANQSSGADTTPPSAATPHVVAATNSSLTISATGSVDA